MEIHQMKWLEAVSCSLISLRGRFHTWSLAYVPDKILEQIAKAAASFANADESLIQRMNELLEYTWNEAAHVRGADNYNKILRMLKQMQKKEVCRGTWCAMYRAHLTRKDNPRCYTIGGLHHFFLCCNIITASEIFDTNKESIEKYYSSKQYPNVFVRLGGFISDSVRSCQQRNSIKDLQVFVDWNSLTEEEARLVVVLLKQTEFITPFVIPRRPSCGQPPHLWSRWKAFVEKQLSSADSSAVIIMKNSRRLIGATDAAARIQDETELKDVTVRSSFDAMQFVWLCAYRQQMTVIGVRKETNNYILQDLGIPMEDPEDESEDDASDCDDDSEENDEEYEEKVTGVFPLGCYQLPGEESSFAEALLMCAFVAKLTK